MSWQYMSCWLPITVVGDDFVEAFETTTGDYVRSYPSSYLVHRDTRDVVMVSAHRYHDEGLIAVSRKGRVVGNHTPTELHELYDHRPPPTGYYHIILQDGRELACHYSRRSNRQYSKGLNTSTAVLEPAAGYLAASRLLGYPKINLSIVAEQLLNPQERPGVTEALRKLEEPASCISVAVTSRMALAVTARLPDPSVQINGHHVGTYDGTTLRVPESMVDAIQREMEKNP